MFNRFKVLCFLSAILVLGGCQSTGINVNSSDQTDATEETQEELAWSEKYDSEETGVLVAVDQEKQTVTVKKIDSGEKFTLNYSGATDVTNQYESAISMKQVQMGEVINLYYSQTDSMARKLQVSSKAWEYTQIENLSFDQTEKTISLGGEKYRYGDSLTIMSDGEEGSLLDLNAIDIVTVKGIDKKVCSIIVTRGHGYISLENDETFIDGWIEISQESAKPITEDMLVVASEGSHKVTVAKNGAGGTKSVTVRRNEKTVVDVGDLKSAAKKSGSLKFTITPSSAILYIDGVKTDYSELVVVDYGAHSVRVKADGYSDYTQTLVVGSSYAEIEINAGTASSSDTTSTSDTSDSQDKTSKTGDGSTTNGTTGTDTTGTGTTGGLNSGTTDSTDTTNSTDIGVESVLTDVLTDLLTE
ncbi:peptidase associated/transthyretin-like domain-containing protein [Konateibacter massiliensis]|uniref:hypothetical protein n=1 Tax=Konateibacter massiliensis TaxID=2002841 RepID=UPI000C15069D|nr:hypothetical protein [Konateibacter massiliensis]